MLKNPENGMGCIVIISSFLYKLQDQAKKLQKNQFSPKKIELELGQCMVTSQPNFSVLTVSNKKKIKGTFAPGTFPEISENVISFKI